MCPTLVVGVKINSSVPSLITLALALPSCILIIASATITFSIETRDTNSGIPIAGGSGTDDWLITKAGVKIEEALVRQQPMKASCYQQQAEGEKRKSTACHDMVPGRRAARRLPG